MATKIQFRRGTLNQIATIIPNSGEPVWATDSKRLIVGDGSLQGGYTIGGSGIGVDSINDLVDDVTISGVGFIEITKIGQVIVVSGNITEVINYEIAESSAIAVGDKGWYEVPYDCEIERVTLLASPSGNIKIDIWKDTYDNFPPTVADTICSGNEPEIVSGVNYQDDTLSGWSIAINAGDILMYNVISCDVIERVTTSLKVKRT